MDNFSKGFGDRFIREVQQIVNNPSELLNESLVALERQKGSPLLDILSADQYPSAPMPSVQTRRDMKRKASQQMYGGILTVDDESLNSSYDAMSTQRAQARKRLKRPSKSDEEDASKKQRGRPRLDTHDATAADRRRTQIRLAQRAYRHRKETTIAGLKKKVADLVTTIQTMNNTYTQLHDKLSSTRLFDSRPAFAQQLVSTAKQFAMFARLAEDSENEDDDNQHEDRHRTNSADIGLDNTSSSKNLQTTSDGSSQIPALAVSEYDMAYSTSSSNKLKANGLDLQTFQALPSEEPEVQQEFQQWNVQFPDAYYGADSFFPTIEKPLTAAHAYTYSFQETTFSRRLHRLCLERAYRVLANPDIDRDYLMRTFRFTFCFANRKSILMRFQDFLSRKAGEPLENWNVPFFRVGGAGMHFPRRDEAGRPIYPPNICWPGTVLRPLRWRGRPETPGAAETVEKTLEAIGFGGEWFDSHDVEEYLKSKGIYPDSTSSFFEVDPAAVSLPSLATSTKTSTLDLRRSTMRTPPPPRAASSFLEGHLDREMQDMFGQARELNFMVSEENPPHTGDDGFAQTSSDSPPSLQDFLCSRPERVTIDVNKFLERMVDGAACLGRAPGFRKGHIDAAIALSLQEGF